MKFPPRDFFLNFASMAALYVSAVSLVTLLFQIINALFPDQLEGNYYYNYDPYSGGIRFAIASLFVVFPLYIFFTRMVHQDIRRNPELKESRFRSWLLYITLFVAGASITGDLIVLINTFLSGELTTRFLLKVLVILVVAGMGFWYYLHELRGTWELQERKSKLIGGVLSLVIIGSIIGGFIVIGSPMKARDVRFDNERLGHLQGLQSNILNYWQQKESFPPTLAALENPLAYVTVPMDPETGEAYGYSVTGPLTFELCATFTLPSDAANRSIPDKSMAPVRETWGMQESWEHPAGLHCFQRTIDPELFPPYKPQI